MDKSYIIRIYNQQFETDITHGTVEDVVSSKRKGFSSAEQLWSIITEYSENQDVGNIVNFKSKSKLIKKSD